MTRRMLSYALAAIVAMATMVPLTGCSDTQTVNVINGIEAQLPLALSQAATIAKFAGNPSLAEVLFRASSAVTADKPALDAAIAAWKASPSSSKLQKIAAVVTAVASNLNAEVLAANGLTITTQDEQLAMISLTGLAAVFNGFAIALGSVNKQAMAMAGGMAVPYSRVAGLIPGVQKREVAASFGVSPNALGL